MILVTGLLHTAANLAAWQCGGVAVLVAARCPLYSAVLYCTEDWVQVSWPLPTDAKLSPQGGDTALGGGQETLPAPLAAVSSLRFLLTTPDSHHYLSLSPHYSLHQETRAKIKDFRIFR